MSYRAALVVFAGLLLATVALARNVKEPGCCVCANGKCIEDVNGMKACADKCAELGVKGVAFNADGMCWSSCAKAKSRIKAGGK